MPYRNAQEVLEARRAELTRRAGELQRQIAELDQRQAELDAVREELAHVQSALDDAGRTPWAALDRMRVASPCRAAWDDMAGDDRARHCPSCNKHVYNLSAMTRTEAEVLVAEHEGRLCVRFYQRSDGTVLTADCPVGQGKRRVHLALVASVGAGILGVAAAAGVLRTGADSHATPGRHPCSLHVAMPEPSASVAPRLVESPPPPPPAQPVTPPGLPDRDPFQRPSLGDGYSLVQGSPHVGDDDGAHPARGPHGQDPPLVSVRVRPR